MSEVCRSCAQAAHCLQLSTKDQNVYFCLYCHKAFLSVQLPSRAAFYILPVSTSCPLAIRARSYFIATPYVCQAVACQEEIQKYFAALRAPT